MLHNSYYISLFCPWKEPLKKKKKNQDINIIIESYRQVTSGLPNNYFRFVTGYINKSGIDQFLFQFTHVKIQNPYKSFL